MMIPHYSSIATPLIVIVLHQFGREINKLNWI